MGKLSRRLIVGGYLTGAWLTFAYMYAVGGANIPAFETMAVSVLWPVYWFFWTAVLAVDVLL